MADTRINRLTRWLTDSVNQKVRQADRDLYDITLGLLAKEFDESIEDMFARIGIKRYTGFYRLPKARDLVAALLREINPK